MTLQNPLKGLDCLVYQLWFTFSYILEYNGAA